MNCHGTITVALGLVLSGQRKVIAIMIGPRYAIVLIRLKEKLKTIVKNRAAFAVSINLHLWVT